MTRGRKKTENKTCFLCLATSQLVKNSDDGDFNYFKAQFKILLQYLLDIRNPKCDLLIKEIIDGEGSELNIQFCENCSKSVKIVGELHKTLEITQLKLIHQLKSIKSIILNEVKTKAEPFKSSSQKLQEVLPLFHQAIREKENLGSVDIPFIFLQKYSPSTSIPLQATAQEPQLEEHDLHSPPIIKNESPDFFDNYNDDLSDSHFDELWNTTTTTTKQEVNSDHPPNQVHPPSIPKLKLKRKSVSTPPSKTTPSSQPPKKRTRKTKPTPDPTNPPIKKGRGRPRLTPSQLASKPKRKPRPNRPPRIRHPLVCLLCPYKTIFPFKFEHHLRSHEATSTSSSSPPSTCPSCSKTFSIPQHYQFHLEGHSNSPNPRVMACDFCDTRVPYSEILSHMSTHLPLQNIFQCPNCSHCSSTREKFLLHLKVHGKGRLPCDLCPLVFTIKCKLLEHLHKVHQTIEKLPCTFPNCTKSFYDPQHLKVHKNIHVNPYSCEICGKIFQDNYKLKVHRRAHTGERPFKCLECDESEDANFLSKACLIRHQIKMHGREKYKCDYCDKEYGDRGMLKVHLTIHEGNGIPCGKCEKVLGSKTLWRRHQLVHSEKLEVICDECGKGFKCRYALKLHKQSHKGEGDKGWICKVCGKAFVIKKYLMDHERTHTGERPFVCSVCGKAFSQHGSLCMHFKKFHPNEKKGESGKSDNDKERGEINCEQLVIKEDNNVVDEMSSR